MAEAAKRSSRPSQASSTISRGRERRSLRRRKQRPPTLGHAARGVASAPKGVLDRSEGVRGPGGKSQESGCEDESRAAQEAGAGREGGEARARRQVRDDGRAAERAP